MFFYVFIAVFVFSWLFEFVLSAVNTNYAVSPKRTIPDVLKDDISQDDFEKSKKYMKDKSKVSDIYEIIAFFLNLFFIIYFLPFTEKFVSGISENVIVQTLLFFGIFALISAVAELPFSYYITFSVENKYGFNKSTKKTFFGDLFKKIILSVIFGGIMISVVVKAVESFDNWWIYVSVIIIAFQFIASWLYPVLIMPLFNKFSPLENENLKEKLVKIAKASGFDISKIYVMDASKRTGHSNAFFTGFGKSKKIVLYDTLLSQHSDEEIEAIFAHEAGHYKMKHILKSMVFSVILMIIIIFTVYFITESDVLNSFGISKIYSKLAYAFIFVSAVFSFVDYFLNFISRKHEFEADNYSKKFVDPEYLIKALKVLNKINLSNINPHPFYAALNYSHPTITERIKNLKR
ncbi:MAG: M48 family metallopeptidase [Thermotogae bacterium]|nr:M48 family metallopeptidase [Thermotogota bacterium]